MEKEGKIKRLENNKLSMKKIKKEVLSIYKYIKGIEFSNEQTRKIEEIIKLKKNKEIDFEECVRKIIPIYKSSLVFEKRKKENKEILRYFSYLFVSINETRWLDGKYQNEIEPISREIKKEERKHGLKDGEFFLLSDTPKEIKALNKKYDEILNEKELEIFKEFLPKEILDFFSSELYNLQKERKRDLRKVKDKDKDKELRKINKKEIQFMNIYYNEFQICYKN